MTKFGEFPDEATPNLTDTLLVKQGTTTKEVQLGDLPKQNNSVGVHDIWIPAGAMLPSTTLPPSGPTQVELASGQDVNTLDFDGAAVESAQFELPLPRNYDNLTITFTAYWSSLAADTDGVTWGLEAVAIGDNQLLTTAYGTRIDVDDANQGAASEELISVESAVLTIGNTPADGKLNRFKVTRQTGDANDTATEDARLHGIMIHVRTDAPVAA